MTLFERFKRWAWPCRHEVFIDDIQIHYAKVIPTAHHVTAACLKCGETLIAPYGLALDATLKQRPKGLK